MGRVNARRRRNPLPKCSLCKDGRESLSRYGYTCFYSYCEVHITVLEQQVNKISVWRQPKIRHPASVFMFSSCYAFMLKLSVIFPGYLSSSLFVFSEFILCSATAVFSIKQEVTLQSGAWNVDIPREAKVWAVAEEDRLGTDWVKLLLYSVHFFFPFNCTCPASSLGLFIDKETHTLPCPPRVWSELQPLSSFRLTKLAKRAVC